MTMNFGGNTQENQELNSTMALHGMISKWGFKSSRGEGHELTINLDDKTATMPSGIAKDLDKLYMEIIQDTMISLGYSMLQIRAAFNWHYEADEEDKVLSQGKFMTLFGQIMHKTEFLPKAFEQAIYDGKLYAIVVGEDSKSIPGPVYGMVGEENIKSIPSNQLKKDKFQTITDGEEPMPGEFQDYHWIIIKQKDWDKLTKLGADPNKIWTIDKLVSHRFLSGNELSLQAMQLMVPYSEMTDGHMKFSAVRKVEILVKHTQDPHPTTKSEQNNLVWLMGPEGKLKQLTKWNYVPGHGIVSEARLAWLWINFLRQSMVEKDVTGKLALSATSTKVREFFEYAHAGSDYIKMSKNTCGIFSIKGNKYLMPSLDDVGSPDLIAEAASAFLVLGIPAVPDAQIKTLYISDGARMRMFDTRLIRDQELNPMQFEYSRMSDEDKLEYITNNPGFVLPEFEVVNANDCTKPSKLTNRGSLDCQLTAQVVQDGTLSHYYNPDLIPDWQESPSIQSKSILTKSGLRVAGVSSEGMRFRVILSNWVLESGSGVAYANPNLDVVLSVNKTERFNEAALYAAGESVESYIQKHLRAWPANPENPNAPAGELVKPGDTLITHKGTPICTFGKADKGFQGYVMGFPNIKSDNEEYFPDGVRLKTFDISGTVPVRVMYWEDAGKVRSFGIKATWYKHRICIKDNQDNIVDQPDLIFGTETIKQDLNFSALIKAYADTVPEGLDYNVSTGLTDEQEDKFNSWKASNIKKAWFWTPRLKARTYRMIKSKYQGDKLFQFDDRTQQVAQYCDYIVADMVLALEVSTVRENMGKQGFIGEQLVAMATYDSNNALDLWDDNADRRAATHSMLRMAAGEATGATWTNGGDNNPKIVFNNMVLEQKGSRFVFEGLRKQFPDGLSIVSQGGKGEIKVNLRFDALAQFTTKADRMGSTTIRIMQHIMSENYDGWTDVLNRYIGMLNGAMLNWVKSRSVFKGMTRTSKIMFSRKIKTINLDILKDGQIGINPKDPVVKTNQIKAGDWVLLSRSPMISVLCLEVVVTDKAPIGTFLVDAYEWHQGNEGDGDGDGSVAYVVPKFKDETPEDYQSRMQALQVKIDNSVFGKHGYSVAWGTEDPNEQPYIEFYEGHLKKALTQDRTGETIIEVAEFSKILRQIGDHYKMFVGKTFAMASALTFRVEHENMLKILLERRPEALTDAGLNLEVVESSLMPGLDTCCAKVWRRIYEGMALSGMSVKALKLADLISEIGNGGGMTIDTTDMLGDDFLSEIIKSKGYKFDPKPSKDGNRMAQHYSGVGAVKVAFDSVADIKLTDDETKAMYWAILVSSLYGKIEREQFQVTSPMFDHEWGNFLEKLPEHFKTGGLLDDAIIYGSLRRSGAGMWENTLVQGSTSLASLVTDDMVDRMLPSYSLSGAVFREGHTALKKVYNIIHNLETKAQLPEGIDQSLTPEQLEEELKSRIITKD